MSISALEEVLREHILYGEKLVRLYSPTRGEAAAAIDGILKARKPRTILRERYPEVLLESELADAPATPVLVAVQEDDHSVSAVFASVRVMQMRETVPADQIPEGARGILERYDEVVGVKHIKYEAFDVVAIGRQKPRAVVMVDYPLGMHKDVGIAAHSVVSHQLTETVQHDIFSRPVNLFPLINAMYRARGEGSVVELAFGTTTASLKHEKMRRQSMCLREEAYHKGGKAALSTPIEPHRLSIVWRRPFESGVSSMPEMGLHTTTAVAGGQHPILFEAEIRKCMGADDFTYALSRLEHFLSSTRQ